MKYSLRYYRESKSKEKYDEIIILYENQNIKDLDDFLKKYATQRIVVKTSFENLIAKELWIEINALIKEHQNLAICFDISYPRVLTEEETNALAQINAPYFLSAAATDWDYLHYLINLQVSDVYIAENLGFDLKAVADFVHGANAQVRVYPNIAQSSLPSTPALQKFFIRPEDVEFYEPYIDIFEFYGEISRQDVLLLIYKDIKHWFGNINDIILDLKYDMDSRSLLPLFGKMRVSCRRDCMRGKRACKLCYAMDDLSKTLIDKGYIFTKKKKD